MFRNYLVTTLRALLKYRGVSLINILGLAISMSVCLVIILFIREETSFDRFHENKDRIYRVNSTVRDSQGVADNLAASPAPLAEAMKAEYAAVTQAVTLAPVKTTAIEGENSLTVSGLLAGPAFFDMFGFELQAGDARTALAKPFTVVLSQEVARKMYGDGDPVGRTLELDQIGDVVVTGVMLKPAGKSHFDRYLEMLLSFSTIEASGAQNSRYRLDDWKSISRFYTYLLLAEGTRPEELEGALSRLIKKHYPDDQAGKYGFFLQALTDIRLGPDLSNKIERQTPVSLLYILGLLALILTLTACFNYMNLSVARSLKRAKEIGIRKVSGAFRQQIVVQFLGEAVIVSWVALAIALLMLEVWVIPAFNNLGVVQGYLQTSISFHFWTEFQVLFIFLGFATLVGILAGLYPAVIFSSYLPSVVLKGTSAIKGFLGAKVRTTLITAQFALSILFIITTLIVQRQSEYMLAADYGFDKEHVVNVALQGAPYEVLKAELLRDSRIEGVSAVSIIPGTGDRERGYFHTRAVEEKTLLTLLNVDENFVANLAIPVIAGRSFSAEFNDQKKAVLLNLAATQKLGFETPEAALGQFLNSSENQTLKIVGVTEDFFHMNLGVTGAMVMICNPTDVNFANVRISSRDVLGAVAYIEETWKTLDPRRPIRYQFYDQQTAAQFVVFRDYVRLITVGAGFIVLVACLGLLGIATYNTETRVKEVGIRKVLGASASTILVLLSRDFLKLIAIAAVIAAPFAWYMNDQLLQMFVYRIDVGVGVLATGIAITVLLALVTVASQAMKASFSNPVDTLKYE